MTGRPTSPTDELVADYVRSTMRVELAGTLIDDVMRSVAALPQERRTWFSAYGPFTPAVAAVAATAVLIIVVGLVLSAPRNVGPPPEPTPTPEPTLTPESALVLTTPGDVVRIPALDSVGQFGTITIERGGERGSYPDYVPLQAMLEGEVFFVELRLTYEVDRHTADPYGANDFAFAVDANGNGFDERDVIKQWIGYDVNGSPLEGGPDPQLPFMGFGDEAIAGWVVAELSAAGAAFDIYLVHVVDARADEAAPGPLEPLASVLLREPGEPVGVTAFDPSLLPSPSGSPLPMPSRHALPTPPPSPQATFEPMEDAETDAVFEETRTCTNSVVGFTVSFPESWHTNDAFEDIPACSWFDPEPIDAEQVFDGLAAGPKVYLTERPDFLAGIEPPTVERLPIAGRIAWRITFREDQSSFGTSYLIPLGDDPYGPFLVGSALEDDGRAALERMLLTLEISD